MVTFSLSVGGPPTGKAVPCGQCVVNALNGIGFDPYAVQYICHIIIVFLKVLFTAYFHGVQNGQDEVVIWQLYFILYLTCLFH
jgi:hypothetical protein